MIAASVGLGRDTSEKPPPPPPPQQRLDRLSGKPPAPGLFPLTRTNNQLLRISFLGYPHQGCTHDYDYHNIHYFAREELLAIVAQPKLSLPPVGPGISPGYCKRRRTSRTPAPATARLQMLAFRQGLSAN